MTPCQEPGKQAAGESSRHGEAKLNPTLRLTLTLAAATAGVFLAGWVVIRVRRWRRKSPEEIERLRRLDVNRRGRIAAGQILDLSEPEPGKPGPRLLLYKYDATGVTYEAAQDIAALPATVQLARRRVGSIVSVKYDPRVPTNSIVACEEWSGLPSAESEAKPEPPRIPSPNEAPEET
jgi:hypothetical protein